MRTLFATGNVAGNVGHDALGKHDGKAAPTPFPKQSFLSGVGNRDHVHTQSKYQLLRR